MAYIPPDSDAADFNFEIPYVPPDSDAADMDLGAGESVEVTAPAFEQTTEITVGEVFVGIPVTAPAFEITGVLVVPTIENFSSGDAVTRYFLVITGAADGLEDVEIPMVSFQARRRADEDSYLQVVIPSVDFIDDIADRSNGIMRIYQAYVNLSGDELQRQSIIETSIDQVNPYQGGNTDSLVLIGYKTASYTAKEVTVYNPTYRAQIDGKLAYRLPTPDIFMNPGDTINIGDDQFILGLMSYTISGDYQQIDLTEAD